jgi:glyoxylase-like metal-dependent hydrolase (beta-lactamase superfamily II)
VNFEGPFIYVLFGQHTVFIQDTGATADPAQFPLYDKIREIMQRRGTPELQMLVTHSHSHGDHKAADAQFRGKPGVTLVEPTGAAVREYFQFTDWPRGEAVIDLGGRKLIVQPSPGHQDEALMVYDSRTRWLFTGDSVYPGRLYVRDWPAFRRSVHAMVLFAGAHPVSAVMGTHIELSSTGEQYPAGTTYQPDEASLPMTTQDLAKLDELLQQAGDQPKEIVTKRFVVSPR